MSATISLIGPSSAPGAPQISTSDINTQVNAALVTNYSATRMPLRGQTGLLIPYFFYPNDVYTDVTFQSLLALLRQYHTVPVMVVLKQDGSDGLGGPGPMDWNYASAIRQLKGANAIVLGYVHTSGRSSETIQADMATWAALYSPGIDGIYLDEFPTDPGTANETVDLFKTYYDYAHTLGLAPIVANVGVDEDSVWYANGTADVFIIWVNDTWPDVAMVAGAEWQGHSDYDYRMTAISVLNQPTLDLAKFQAMQPYLQWISITNATFPDEYAALPSYLSSLFAACALPAQGEYVSASVAAGAAVALTTATPANVTTITLTAGTWDVSGTIGFTPAGTTSITNLQGGIDSTSATLPAATTGALFAHFMAATVPGAVNPAYATGTRRLVLPATTNTIYLVAQAAFTVSTMGAFGFLSARRVPA